MLKFYPLGLEGTHHVSCSFTNQSQLTENQKCMEQKLNLDMGHTIMLSDRKTYIRIFFFGYAAFL